MFRAAVRGAIAGMLVGAVAAEGGQATGSPEGASAPVTELALPIEGPPPPVPPEMVRRDAAGRTTLRAVRVAAPLRIDGALDEALYADVAPVSGFIQVEPRAGEPAVDRTDVWVSFDDDNVYVSMRCWDSRMDALVATDMRRDGQAAFQGSDVVAFTFDTFYDRRSAMTFTMNPIGGRQDGQATSDRQFSLDWNPVWDGKVGRFEGGWTFEAAVPFKSLRYRAGREQIWGFNALRVKRATNEISFITRMSNARGQGAINQASQAATLVGIEAPETSRNIDLKPYATSSMTTDRTAVPGVSNDPDAEVGFDLKVGLTEGLTADFTYHTDFAQVEADDQQINLTRFSLFFPEKREFFLENQGTFAFGGVSATGVAGDAPILFYSRRIGLNQGRAIPLDVGGRVTGRAGPYTLGLINIQAGDEPVSRTASTNFSVVRLKRDVLRKSAIGVIATGRSVGQTGAGGNQAYGVDGTFAFYDNLGINMHWATTRTDGLRGEDTSYRGQLDYNGDRYGVQLERMMIGSGFNPEVGFVRRADVLRTHGQLRFSPRPRPDGPFGRRVRRFSYIGTAAHIENGTRQLETRERGGEFAIEFHTNDRISVGYGDIYEFLPRPFRIATGVVLPVGGYQFHNLELGFNVAQQRRLAANLLFEHGTFYNGHRTAFSAARGRARVTHQLFVEPTYSLNRVQLVEGDFTTQLAGARLTYTLTPEMFASALVQYNSGTGSVSANVRLRWEYRPGSEFFIVYNEDRNTFARRFPDLFTRALMIKVNRLFRF